MATTARIPVTRDEIFERIDESWRDWVLAVEAVPADRRTQPGVAGDWSVKELIAHLSLWERHIPRHIERWQLGLAPAHIEVDELNAEIASEYRDRSFDLVVMEMHRAHLEAMAAIRSISAELDDDIRKRIAGETWDHYPEHTEQIRAWLRRNDAADSDPQEIAERYVRRVDQTLDLVGRIPADRIAEVGVTEQWSVKDLVGHCAYWDGVHISELETEFAGGTILEDDREDDVINAEQFQVRTGWTWQQVIDEATSNRDRLAALLQRPSQYNQSGSGEHWDEHRAQIEAWIRSAGVGR